MIHKLKRWIISIVERNLNNINYFLCKNISNLSFFYLLIFTTSWFICNYKLQQLHEYNLIVKGNLEYNNKYLMIKNFINNCTEITRGVHYRDPKFVLDLEESMVNKKIDINLLYNIVLEKKATKQKIAIWEESFDIWKNFKAEPRNQITNFFKNTTFSEENENQISILKKNKIKILFGLGLLITSDLILKNILI